MESHPATPRRMSIEEWEALPEDEDGELVDGWLVEDEMPDTAHGMAVVWLVEALGPWLRARTGRLCAGDLKLRLTAALGRKADVAAWFGPHPALPRHRAVGVPPDLVVEVVSPSPRDARRDRVEKSRDYAAFGVPSYWILDPGARRLEILRLDGGRYRAVLEARAGRLEAVPGCDGLTLDLDALWTDVDALLEADT